MGLLGPSREPRGPDRFLELKLLLFGIGAALALTGIFLQQSLLVWLAFTPLAAAFVLRFFDGRRKPDAGARAPAADEAPAGDEDPTGNPDTPPPAP